MRLGRVSRGSGEELVWAGTRVVGRVAGRGRTLLFALGLVLALVVSACAAEGNETSEDSDSDAEAEGEDSAENDAEDSNEEDGAEASEDDGEAEASFEGETLRMIVGTGPGGGFDQVARTIAERLPDHLPGSPTVIVQNQPGAGTVVAANSVYNMQPSDGRTMVMMHFGSVIDSITGALETEFDPFDFEWVGEASGDLDPVVVYARSELEADSIDGLNGMSETAHFGQTTRGAAGSVLIEVLAEAGYPVEMVYGYTESTAFHLAVQQDELDGAAVAFSTMTTIGGDDLEGGDIKVLGSLGTSQALQDLGAQNVLEADLGLEDEQRELIEFIAAGSAHFRVFALPPGTPPEWVAAWRGAFEEVLAEPDVQERLSALGLTPGFTDGDEIRQTVDQLMQTSPEVMDAYVEYTAEE